MVGESAASLSLPYRPPYDWRAVAEFLRPRAIPGVEEVGPDLYRRSFVLGRCRGVVEVRPAAGGDGIRANVLCDGRCDLDAVSVRLRRLFDLDAEAAAIDRHLAADPLLAERVRSRPGIRVPGAWDGFELAVRAVLGQQISVAAATTFAGRIAARHGARLELAGSVRLLFPSPQAVAKADLTEVGLTRARAATLQALARATADDPELLRPQANLEEAVRTLCALPGIGAWTAHYVAMRAQGEADAFPASDLGLLRGFAPERTTPPRLLAAAARWRPWRAYAAMRLWLQPCPPGGTAIPPQS